MIIHKRVATLTRDLDRYRRQGKIIGFVPTMGALHEGHLSLAERSRHDCDITAVSIFVNPKQFNDPEDLIKYPRPLEADLKMLLEQKVDIVFVPEVEDVYPPGLNTKIDFDPGPASRVMEGAFRPGHFDGMAEVVHRLLDIVRPDKLYMGQKDFQQLAIIRQMISDLHMPIILEMCPTLREPHGLAMSSRNTRLSENARKEASIIYTTLTEAQRRFEEEEPVAAIKRDAMETLSKAGFEPEYFEIVDGLTFQNVDSYADSQYVVALCAIRVEGIRLIDNDIWIRKE